MMACELARPLSTYIVLVLENQRFMMYEGEYFDLNLNSTVFLLGDVTKGGFCNTLTGSTKPINYYVDEGITYGASELDPDKIPDVSLTPFVSHATTQNFFGSGSFGTSNVRLGLNLAYTIEPGKTVGFAGYGQDGNSAKGIPDQMFGMAYFQIDF